MHDKPTFSIWSIVAIALYIVVTLGDLVFVYVWDSSLGFQAIVLAYILPVVFLAIPLIPKIPPPIALTAAIASFVWQLCLVIYYSDKTIAGLLESYVPTSFNDWQTNLDYLFNDISYFVAPALAIVGAIKIRVLGISSTEFETNNPDLGTMPIQATSKAADPGWYPNPQSGGLMQYWDGEKFLDLPTSPSAPELSPTPSTFAIVSLIAAFFMPILAVIFGHLAKGEIRRSRGLKNGDGMATAGLILGYLGIAGIVLWIIFILIAASQTQY